MKRLFGLAGPSLLTCLLALSGCDGAEAQAESRPDIPRSSGAIPR